VYTNNFQVPYPAYSLQKYTCVIRSLCWSVRYAPTLCRFPIVKWPHLSSVSRSGTRFSALKSTPPSANMLESDDNASVSTEAVRKSSSQSSSLLISQADRYSTAASRLGKGRTRLTKWLSSYIKSIQFKSSSIQVETLRYQFNSSWSPNLNWIELLGTLGLGVPKTTTNHHTPL
jgi:hypothetical protein